MTTTTDVPGLYPVALNGRGFNVYYVGNTFRSESIPLIRNQADTRGILGEQSLSAEELWRRSQRSWHHGAGQTNFDEPDSDPARFRSSQGVFVWIRNQVSLLNGTSLIRTTATRPYLATAGSRLYVADGNTLNYTTDGAAYTAVTGITQIIQSMATDGYTVYVAAGTDGIRSIDPVNDASDAFTASGGNNISRVAYVNGRIMAAVGPSIYNIVVGGGAALPAPLFTHAAATFTWTAFAEGASHFYAAGYIGDQSTIYKITIQPDGTALAAPTTAAPVLVGEQIVSMLGYGGYLILGTDKGVRLCAVDAAGNLTIGPRNTSTNGQQINGLFGYGQYVWYGWSNFAVNTTGLGRMDLATFVDTLLPAYASDLMAPAGSTFDVVRFGNRLTFAVDTGVYVDSGTLVSSGYVQSGIVTYELTAEKNAQAIETTHKPKVSGHGAGTYTVSLSADESAFAAVGAAVSNDGTRRSTRTTETVGTAFEVKHTITRGAGNNDDVAVTGWTMKAQPVPDRGEIFDVPLHIVDQDNLDGTERSRDCEADITYLRSLLESTSPVDYQEGSQTIEVFVTDMQWIRQKRTHDGRYFQGIALMKLKRLL